MYLLKYSNISRAISLEIVGNVCRITGESRCNSFSKWHLFGKGFNGLIQECLNHYLSG
jgi:hypothetical protein